MTGYQEILTDPSYCQQIVTLTYPHIGNYGINAEDVEADKVHAAGLVISDLPLLARTSARPRRCPSTCVRENTVAIADIDTRKLTRHPAQQGRAERLHPGLAAGEAVTQALIDKAVAARARPRPAWPAWTWPRWCRSSSLRVDADRVEAGRGLRRADQRRSSTSSPSTTASRTTSCACSPSAAAASRWCRRRRRPPKCSQLKPDGIFLSNGPGDPEPCDYAIEATRELIETGIPTFGICLGHQIMALASGAKTFKMKFGHHGANHPVKDLDNGRVSITSQNHGFAVDAKTLPANLRATHVCLFDGTLQGLARTDKPAFCFQGHPEASPGPHDIGYLFDRFTALMEQHGEEARMPKRTDLKSILIIGAGPIVIGQACEFDYSGAQACKALREEGYKVILVNTNPATIMTDPDMADVTYIEPITWQMVEKIIAKERPDAILPTMGGQTALNCALDLCAQRRAGQVQRRADRRHARSHRQGRRPR